MSSQIPQKTIESLKTQFIKHVLIIDEIKSEQTKYNLINFLIIWLNFDRKFNVLS